MVHVIYWLVCEWLKPCGTLTIRKTKVNGKGQLGTDVFSVRFLGYSVYSQMYDLDRCCPLLSTGQLWLVIFRLIQFIFNLLVTFEVTHSHTWLMATIAVYT